MGLSRNRSVALVIVSLVVATVLVVVGCSSDKEPAAQEAQVVIQAGQLQPAPAEAQPTGWDTEFSQKLGVTLLATYDSSGEPAWDPAKHPLVFFTTVGPGYGGLLSGVEHPGFAIIDANTHEVVAYRAFDLEWEDVFEPHGLGVSPDGQWVYLPTGEGRAEGRFLIINARTLKLDKVLATRGRPHHAKGFTDSQGRGLALLYGWEQPPFVLDPQDDNRVVGGADFNDMGIEGYLYFVDPKGEEMWASGRWRLSSARGHLHDNVVIVMDTSTWELKDYIPIADSTPIWVDFTADGKYAYISGGHSSIVVKYDREAKETVATARAGVHGPYGIRLSWDEKVVYTVGKGEGSHNRGKDLGMVDTELMHQRGRPVDQFITNCIRGDHATIHPDPEKNELWLSCNSSFEIVVFDMGNNEVKARIPMPSGGSTHSGSFVKYNPDFTGEVLSDQNGLHGSALQKKVELLQALAQK